MARATELRELEGAELLTRLEEAREELFNLRFQHATGQLDNVTRLSHVRREIARISTVLREREIEAAEQLGPTDQAGRPGPSEQAEDVGPSEQAEDVGPSEQEA